MIQYGGNDIGLYIGATPIKFASYGITRVWPNSITEPIIIGGDNIVMLPNGGKATFMVVLPQSRLCHPYSPSGVFTWVGWQDMQDNRIRYFTIDIAPNTGTTDITETAEIRVYDKEDLTEYSTYYFSISVLAPNNNVIYYTTRTKGIYPNLDLTRFKGENDSQLSLVSHTAEDGYCKLEFDAPILKITGSGCFKGGDSETDSQNIITSIWFPDSLTYFENTVCQYQKWLVRAHISDACTCATGMFSDCTRLVEVNVPASYTGYLWADYLSYCKNLGVIKLPAGVNGLAWYAMGQSKVNILYIYNDTELLGSNISNSPIYINEIYVPANLLQAYKNDEWWGRKYGTDKIYAIPE